MTAQLAIDFSAKQRDAGHADSLSHYVVELVRLTLVEVSERLPAFTSDDVLDALPQMTRASLETCPQAMGAIFRRAALAKEIHDTGRMVRTRSAKGRKRRVVVWERGA